MSVRIPLLALGLPGCIFVNLGPGHVESETFTVDVPVEGVQFDLPAGDVSFHTTDGGFVTLTWTLRYRGDPPSTSAQVSDDALFLDAQCPDLARSCSVDIDVLVPEGVWVAGETGAGDIEISGVSAGVDVVSGAGDIDLRNLVGFVGASSGAGDITGRTLDSHEVRADTGAGDLDLEVVGEIDLVSMESGAGDLVLAVPGGTYAVQATSGAGHVDIDGITVDSGAEALLHLETGTGDVFIRGF